MTNDTILDSLVDARKIAFAIWTEYHEKSRRSSIWEDMRDYYEMRVRALDYAMEALRNDTV